MLSYSIVGSKSRSFNGVNRKKKRRISLVFSRVSEDISLKFPSTVTADRTQDGWCGARGIPPDCSFTYTSR